MHDYLPVTITITITFPKKNTVKITIKISTCNCNYLDSITMKFDYNRSERATGPPVPGGSNPRGHQSYEKHGNASASQGMLSVSTTENAANTSCTNSLHSDNRSTRSNRHSTGNDTPHQEFNTFGKFVLLSNNFGAEIKTKIPYFQKKLTNKIFKKYIEKIINQILLF